MAKISLSVFEDLKDKIKGARTAEQFHYIYSALTAFCPDENILHLAQLFNNQANRHLTTVSANQLIDTDHICRLIELQESARAVRQHIAYVGYEAVFQANPLNFHTHIMVMNNHIEEQKGNKNYSYYCQYYLDNVFFPYAEHHPKIYHNPPSCVRELLERYTATNELEQSVNPGCGLIAGV